MQNEATEKAIVEQVIEILSEQCNVDKESINLDSNLTSDIQADSLDMIEAIMDIEDTFDIAITDSEINKMHTVRNIVHYISDVLSGVTT